MVKISTFNDINELLSLYNNSFVPLYDGRIHRFSSNGKSKSCWFVGFLIGNTEILNVGDWRNPEGYHQYCSKAIKTKEEKEAFKVEFKLLLKKVNDEKIEYQNSCAEFNKHEFFSNKATSNIKDFDYCKKKNIDDFYGSSFVNINDTLCLGIPAINEAGEFRNFQTISKSGTKLFQQGQMFGCFHKIVGNEKYILCEGFATGVSIHKATGATVIICFFANNLFQVAKIFKHKNPIIACDNDAYGEDNAGLMAGKKIKADLDIDYIYPVFPNGEKSATDFNDYESMFGIQSLKDLLSSVFQQNKNSEHKTMEMDLTEYHEFKKIFEARYPNAGKCLFTGIFWTDQYDHKNAEPIVNNIEVLKSDVLAIGLPVSRMIPYLYRWEKEFTPKVLLKGYQEWDGKDRIAEIFSYVKFKKMSDSHCVEIIKDWFGKMWARVENPANQNFCMIFHGNQGIGKDTLINSILSGLKTYYSSIVISHDEKNNFDMMNKSIAINISEFERTSKTDISTLKNMITASSMTYRSAYAREATRKVLRTSFISTTNFEDALVDSSGNRRFKFLYIDSIDYAYSYLINESYCMQILAQAYHLFKTNYKPSNEAIAAAKEIIDLLSPDSIEDKEAIVLREYCERIKVMAVHLGTYRLDGSQTLSIFADLTKTFNMSDQGIRKLIKRNLLSKKVNDRIFYYYDKGLRGEYFSDELNNAEMHKLQKYRNLTFIK